MITQEARDAFKEAGLTYEVLNKITSNRLAYLINKRMKVGNYINGSFVVDTVTNNHFTTCSSDYFKGRECVSFNRDGFIGFAGWASTTNLQPILLGFMDWIEEMKS